MSLQETIALQNPVLARAAEPERVVCAISSWRSRSEQPARDGPHDAQPRGGRQCAQSACRHLLRPAGLRWADRDRGDASEPAGRRLYPHPGHPFGRASRRLADDHRRGPSRRQQIFAQLWHVGRVSHPDFHDGALPVAPSALPVEGEAFTTRGRTKLVTPRALETDELPGIVATVSRRRPRTPKPPGSTAWNSMAPTATCSTSSCAMAPTSAPTPTAAASKTAPACRSKWSTR